MENLREIQIKHRRDRSDVVKVNFSSTYKYVGTEDKNLRCHIVIGNEIVDLLQWKTKDFIHIFDGDSVDSLVLKKNNMKGRSRFKLRYLKNTTSHMISIPFFKEVKSTKICTVPHEVIEMEDGKKVLRVFVGDITNG